MKLHSLKKRGKDNYCTLLIEAIKSKLGLQFLQNGQNKRITKPY